MAEITICERIDTETEVVYLAAIGGKRHQLIIPLAAITNRRAVYGLETDEAAIVAILREHVTRILALPPDTQEDAKLAAMGGLRADVTIRQGTLDDLPALPPPEPTAKEKLAAAVSKATTLADVKAAILTFAEGE